ncbi:hypothetical protein [Nocardia amamiensis]|uniref:hypothetical protein n=1 Tax=Nocardia amamiensis TaxID=404578 RepID=UPI000B21B5C3|nr:hypothetical protein [Nocardia amamiensis]
MADHKSLADLRQERVDRPDFNAAEYYVGREEARQAIEFANAIRERRAPRVGPRDRLVELVEGGDHKDSSGASAAGGSSRRK